MRIAVIGANGRTGQIVVEDALARGHEVAVVTRTEGVRSQTTTSPEVSWHR